MCGTASGACRNHAPQFHIEMRNYIKLIAVAIFSIIAFAANAYDIEKAKEAMPFLKSDYAYEYLRVQKKMMGDKVVGENRTVTTYNDNYLITSVITTDNGQKSIELVDYVYGDQTRSHKANTYMNGQLFTSENFSDVCGDDFYRNMTVSESTKTQLGNSSNIRVEWTYDDADRIIGMKQYQDGKLQLEQKDYTWTPNSCEYVTVTYFPIASTDKVKKTFRDTEYVQNILETHDIDMNGLKTSLRSEFAYDDNGNLISMRNYNNDQLLMEWKDYIWGDKKSTHKEIMYMNGNIISESLVEQFYK